MDKPVLTTSVMLLQCDLTGEGPSQNSTCTSQSRQPPLFLDPTSSPRYVTAVATEAKDALLTVHGTITPCISLCVTPCTHMHPYRIHCSLRSISITHWDVKIPFLPLHMHCVGAEHRVLCQIPHALAYIPEPSQARAWVFLPLPQLFHCRTNEKQKSNMLKWRGKRTKRFLKERCQNLWLQKKPDWATPERYKLTLL